jgi:hypothetical protein
MNEITAITAHDCFGAAFELFGKFWPAVGPLILFCMSMCVGAMIRELWRTGRW